MVGLLVRKIVPSTAAVTISACFIWSCGSDGMANSGQLPEGRSAPSSVGVSNDTTSTPASDPIEQTQDELARMQAFVNNRIDRSKVRKTLQERSGRKVDCLDINAQPALKGLPVLPPPPAEVIERMSAHPKTPPPPAPELFAPGKNTPDKCEEGTVPVRDVTIEDVRRFATLDDFFRKAPGPGGAGSPSFQQHTLEAARGSHLDEIHEYAVMARDDENRGAYAYFNVWNPYTESSDQTSIAQIWVTAPGPFGTETVETGFNVYGDKYGDLATHFFIFSTRDGYSGTWAPNCYNNWCGDFVQLSQTWFPGAAVPASEVGGNEWNAEVQWYKGTGSIDAWWVIAFGEIIGYYPTWWYVGLAVTAASYKFGGEVGYFASGGHSETDMGSGSPPGPDAAWMWYLQYYTPSGTATQATGLSPIVSNSACYDTHWWESGPTFLRYGGTGFEPSACP